VYDSIHSESNKIIVNYRNFVIPIVISNKHPSKKCKVKIRQCILKSRCKPFHWLCRIN